MENVIDDLVYEEVHGMLVARDNVSATLVIGDNLEFSATPLAHGVLVLRYGIPYLYESHFSMIPAQFIAERGGELQGWKAWNYVFRRFELHPRGEIIGLRSDGEMEQVTLKMLDIANPVRIYAYANLEERVPLALVTQVIAPEEVDIPKRLKKYLPT